MPGRMVFYLVGAISVLAPVLLYVVLRVVVGIKAGPSLLVTHLLTAWGVAAFLAAALSGQGVLLLFACMIVMGSLFTTSTTALAAILRERLRRVWTPVIAVESSISGRLGKAV